MPKAMNVISMIVRIDSKDPCGDHTGNQADSINIQL